MDVMKMIKPLRLKEKDAIGIVAPACSVDRHSLHIGAEKLKRLGFKIKYSSSIFKKYMGMAGTDRERAEQINSMFADKNIKAIFCAKAGHGSLRLLPYLDKKIIAKNPKIFIGYSDIAILLCYLQKVANMIVFHGPVLCGEIHESMNQLTLKYLLAAITQSAPMRKLAFDGIKTLRPSKADGILIGGNISMIVNSIGAPYEIDTDNKILFLEDLNESIEAVDSYLMRLKLAGKLDNIKGLIFGRMIGCSGCLAKGFNIKKIVDNILGNRKIPVIYGFPSGHRRPHGANITLPLGAHTSLDANNRCLIINEPAVK